MKKEDRLMKESDAEIKDVLSVTQRVLDGFRIIQDKEDGGYPVVLCRELAVFADPAFTSFLRTFHNALDMMGLEIAEKTRLGNPGMHWIREKNLLTLIGNSLITTKFTFSLTQKDIDRVAEYLLHPAVTAFLWDFSDRIILRLYARDSILGEGSNRLN